MLVTETVDLIGSVTEEEDLLVSDFLRNLDRSSVDSGQQETAVEGELRPMDVVRRKLVRDGWRSMAGRNEPIRWPHSPSCWKCQTLRYRQWRCAERCPRLG